MYIYTAFLSASHSLSPQNLLLRDVTPSQLVGLRQPCVSASRTKLIPLQIISFRRAGRDFQAPSLPHSAEILQGLVGKTGGCLCEQCVGARSRQRLQCQVTYGTLTTARSEARVARCRCRQEISSFGSGNFSEVRRKSREWPESPFTRHHLSRKTACSAFAGNLSSENFKAASRINGRGVVDVLRQTHSEVWRARSNAEGTVAPTTDCQSQGPTSAEGAMQYTHP